MTSLRKSQLITTLPDIIFFGTIAIAIICNTLLPVVRVAHSPFTLIGWGVAIIGFCLALTLLRYQRIRATSTNAGDVPTQLITSDIYARTRNPYYLTIAITLAGVAVGLGSLTAFMGPLLYIIVINFAVVPTEENVLEKKFGDDYRKYRQNVRRWL